MGWLKQQTLICHGSGGWEVQDQGTDRFSVWWELVEREREREKEREWEWESESKLCYLLLVFFFFFLNYLFNLFIWLCQIFVEAHGIFVVACGIFSWGMRALSCSMRDLVPQPGIKPRPPALGAWSPNHWTTREVPHPGLIRALIPLWETHPHDLI